MPLKNNHFELCINIHSSPMIHLQFLLFSYVCTYIFIREIRVNFYIYVVNFGLSKIRSFLFQQYYFITFVRPTNHLDTNYYFTVFMNDRLQIYNMDRPGIKLLFQLLFVISIYAI